MAQISLNYINTQDRRHHALGQDYKCVLLSTPSECQLFLILPSDMCGGKYMSQLSRSVVVYHIPEARSTCFSKDTTSGRTASIGVSNWLSVWDLWSSSTIIYLICVRVRLIELNMDILGTTTLACVWPRKVAIISLSPLEGNFGFDLLSWLEGWAVSQASTWFSPLKELLLQKPRNQCANCTNHEPRNLSRVFLVPLDPLWTRSGLGLHLLLSPFVSLL